MATIFWTVMTATLWKHVFDVEQVSTLTGATASLLSLALGYFIRDRLRSEKIGLSRWSIVPGRRKRLAAIETNAAMHATAATVNAVLKTAATASNSSAYR